MTSTSAPTIFDVAAAAGVSVSTVSRVLNDRTDVSALTRQHVHDAIQELGFAPRLSARRLAQQQSWTISLLFPAAYASPSSYDLDFVLGAATATEERSYFFKLVTEPLAADAVAAMYRSGAVDGVILMQILEHDPRVDHLTAQGLPFVMIGRTADPGACSYVDFDFEAAMEKTYELLRMLGHEHIGLLGRPQAQLDAAVGSAVRLQRGAEAAAVKHGLVPRSAAGGLDRLAAGQAALGLLDAHPELSAIVTTHGPSAAGVLQALRARGLRVPEDVSVAGLATETVADMLTPQLTGPPFPSAELGRRAAAMLVRQLEMRAAGRPAPLEQVLLPAALVVRESTAPPHS